MHSHIEKLNRIADEFIAVRHAIHRHPELGYKELKTSELVIQQLKSWGYLTVYVESPILFK